MIHDAALILIGLVGGILMSASYFSIVRDDDRHDAVLLQDIVRRQRRDLIRLEDALQATAKRQGHHALMTGLIARRMAAIVRRAQEVRGEGKEA